MQASDLQCKQQKEGFHAVEPSIDEVAHEEIVDLGAFPSNLEQLQEIIKLAMDITT